MLPPYQEPIHYQAEMATLVALIQSGSDKGNHVIEVLQTGDEELIRHMLSNFGNPADEEWASYTEASPWADWQITQAADDANMVKPKGPEAMLFAAGESGTGKFWAW